MDRLHHPAEDLRYLISRGYPKSSALEFVSNHYTLSREERNILVRVVHEKEIIDSVRRKLITIDEARGERIAIDGFNIIATVSAMLKGETVFQCDDGIIRDASGLFGRFKINSKSLDALKLCCKVLQNSFLIWFFDKNVSKSGEFAKITRNIMQKEKISGEAVTAGSVDFELRRWDGVVATGDTGIIVKAKKVVDVPSHVMKLLGIEPLRI